LPYLNNPGSRRLGCLAVNFRTIGLDIGVHVLSILPVESEDLSNQGERQGREFHRDLLRSVTLAVQTYDGVQANAMAFEVNVAKLILDQEIR
jgi:hypothetical protein